jgi:ankyrin repeat protein
MAYKYNAQSMLLEAVYNGHVNNVALTINSGELDVNEPLECYNHTPLKTAIRGGQKEIAILLIEKGADIDQKAGENGNSPLHDAAVCGYEKIVDVLLSCGADSSSKNYNGYKASELAKQSRHYQIANKLESLEDQWKRDSS